MSDCGDTGGSFRSTSGRRRALFAACAAFVAAVALGLPGSGCLNPRPEELPSAEASRPNADFGAGPVRETCSDNPLLAGCDLPPTDINDEPVSETPAPGTESNVVDDGTPEPAAPGDEAAGPAGGGGGGDAGTPADAGAP